MTEPDPRIIEAAVNFLRGETSAVDFTYAFRAAMNLVVRTRLLDGVELDLSDLLERWEEAGWRDRPDVVDRLRSLCRVIAGL